MAAALISYNGFVFDETKTSSEVSARPVMDPSGRTVSYVVYTIRVRSKITGTLTDQATLQARRQLTTQGGALIYEGRGLGAMSINTAQVRDVKWGPKPALLALRPLGGQIATEIDWSVEVAIPECSAARYAFAPLAFVFSVSWSIKDGYTTRTVTGHLEIPSTRRSVGDRTLVDHADAYRDQINPPIPEGFERSWGPWVLSEDKCRLDFSITDTEMGANIPPEQVYRVRASHEYSSSSKGLKTWSGTINAEYELGKRADVGIAARAFFQLVKDRIQGLAQGVNLDNPQDAAAKAILPVALSISEPEIYGMRKAVFSLGYTFTGTVSTVLQSGGLWRPVPNSNWRRWRASLDTTVFDPRGTAGLEFDLGDDQIVDLCAGNQQIGFGANTTVLSAARPYYGPTGAAPLPNPQVRQLVGTAFPPPAKGVTWVSYENEIFLESDAGVVPLRLLPSAALDETSDLFGSQDDIAGQAWDAVKGVIPRYATGAGTAGPGLGSALRRVFPSVYVYLTGRAARAGETIPIPRLLTINGIPAVPANRLDRGEGYAQGVRFAAGDVPVYTARWNLRYALAAVPSGTLPIPPNPFLGGK